MVTQRERAVEVMLDRGPSAHPRWSLGSGFLVGDGLVLTAAHVVAGEGEIVVRMLGKRSGDPKIETSASIHLMGEIEVADLALLRLDHGGDDLPPAVFKRLDLTAWEASRKAASAVGFPRFKDWIVKGNRIRDTRQADGHFKAGDGMFQGWLTLNVDSPPPVREGQANPWSGMSGAGVVCKDEVVGVVAMQETSLGASVLTVTPLSFVDRLADPLADQWRRALGFTKKEPPVADTFTIIQLSRVVPDLPDPRDRARYHEGLVADLTRELHRSGVEPDLIVAPAGLTRTGSWSEFSEALSFLSKLGDALDLGRDRFVLLPGHDDVGEGFWAAHNAGARHASNSIGCPGWPDSTNVDKAMDDFYGDRPQPFRFADGAPWILLEDPSNEVVVAGFNSALRRDCAAPARGYIGAAQVEWFAEHIAARRKSGWLTLGVVHDAPSPALGPAEDGLLLQRLGSMLDCVVHGGPQASVSWFGALGLVGARTDVAGSYQVIQVRRHSGRIRIYRRIYDNEDRRWKGDLSVSRDRRTWWSGWLGPELNGQH
ncbi:trypsin-like peptidase domain-containing protein [Dactylosporangium sp. CA-233914]|uniref:trypsin-like peptidase domain-containing protein n=1 Tax=Dactylosporangium sp. CA-233914 TaxID=3239934 RepID=UPI003D9057BF